MLVRLVMLLLIVAVGGFGYLYYRSNRLIKSEPYQAALKFVTESKLVKEKVGEPLVPAGLLDNLRDGSNVSESDAQLQFKMMSPKGAIEVSGSGRKRDNDWSIQNLAVLLPGEKEKLSLMSEVNLVTAGDTPKFDANNPPAKAPTDVKLVDPADLKFDEIPMPPQ